MVAAGELTFFEELESGDITEIFGNVAHRFSTYEKRGTMNGRIRGEGHHLDAVRSHTERMEDHLDGVG